MSDDSGGGGRQKLDDAKLSAGQASEKSAGATDVMRTKVKYLTHEREW